MSSKNINLSRLDELATELASGVKSEIDLSNSLGELMKLTIEKALNAEMDAHLGCKKHSIQGRNKLNSLNGYISKNLKITFFSLICFIVSICLNQTLEALEQPLI